MGFYTGAAIDPTGLLQTIATVATAEGFTLNRSQAADSDPADDWEICLQKFLDGEEKYWNWRSARDSLYLQVLGSTGYDPDPSTAAGQHPGTTILAARATPLQLTMKGYWIFSGPRYIHVVIETQTGFFSHVGMGVVDKCFDYQGGEYGYGVHLTDPYESDGASKYHEYPFDSCADETVTTSTSSWIRAVGDGADNGWYYFTTATGSGVDGRVARGQTRNDSFIQLLKQASGPIHYSGKGALFPNYLFARKTTGTFHYLGAPPDMRCINTNAYTPGQSFQLGADTWWPFPIIHQGGSGPDSSTYGLAFKQVD